MGMQDRDWYREEMRNRERQRQQKAKNATFTGSPSSPLSLWASAAFRTAIYCLATYGALSLIKRFFL
jgi:hypothetical protein